MAGFDTYKDAFPHTKLTRSQEGVLEVVLHMVVSTTPAYHRKRVVAPFSFSEADCPLISRYVNPSWDKGWSGYLTGENSTQGGDR